MLRFASALLVCGFIGAVTAAAESLVPTSTRQYVETASLPAEEATQAAACDEDFVYAVASAQVAKYDRASGKRLAISTGAARHLNSAFLADGELYCAHSNFPAKPERSEILVLDPATMELTTWKNFGEYRGSLTWVVRHDGAWWCTFARYGAENGATALVKFDSEWRELGAWKYPPEVVADLGRYSISGGVWKDGDLLATGHDRRVLYRLRLPPGGEVLQLAEVIRTPFPGQGIAVDPKTGGLVGIDRKGKRVVFAELRE